MLSKHLLEKLLVTIWQLSIFLLALLSGCTVTLSTPSPTYIPSNAVKFSGTVGFTLPAETGSKVNLRFEKIENLRPQGLSGTLRLSLWATENPYDGNSLNGKIIAEQLLGQLNGGGILSDGNYSTIYIEPPKGTYYITLALEEYNSSNKWSLLNAVQIDNKMRTDTRFSIGRHYIAGASASFINSGNFSVIKDYKVSQLRVRVVRQQKPECKQGFQDHIELDGPIGDDSTFAVAKTLEQITQCVLASGIKKDTSIYLNSSGGLLKDGFSLGRYLRKYEAQAVVTGGQICASACAVAFLGGKHRQIELDGQLLFHAPYIKVFRNDRFQRILCSRAQDSEDLKNYYVSMLGKNEGDTLFDRTMTYCSNQDGWTVNADAAKLYGLTNVN